FPQRLLQLLPALLGAEVRRIDQFDALLPGERLRAVADHHHVARPVHYRARERDRVPRSEEHTSELQSRENLVCRLLLEKKTCCRFWCYWYVARFGSATSHVPPRHTVEFSVLSRLTMAWAWWLGGLWSCCLLGWVR